MRVAILDDYQGVALRMADWRSLHPAAEEQAFTDHLDDLEALAARLRPFQAVVLMRERTPFPRALFERLTSSSPSRCPRITRCSRSTTR
ncbi:hypothetical protein [Sorangium sp. So ce426]|uniref:hypothetical protein n=1 Tax=unclassified Sorangium TaxID=2621164 RepID=UPI003F5C820F